MNRKIVTQLYRKYATPSHVQAHCRIVTEFAQELAQKLIKNGHKIDLKSLEYACLLHDFVRVIDFRTWQPQIFAPKATPRQKKIWDQLRHNYRGCHHADVAQKILLKLGEEKIARLVAAHKFDHILKGFQSWEEKLIYYADKRAMHDNIVGLEERLLEGKKRNGDHLHFPKTLKKIYQEIYKLEKEILDAINEQD